MAVKIRMKRVGTKNTPVYRIVVADGRSPRDGKFIEEIGTYQPLKKDNNFVLDLERAKYWVHQEGGEGGSRCSPSGGLKGGWSCKALLNSWSKGW
jgi:small subunit ribosomal protein S16